MKKWKRKCSKCGEEILYSRKDSKIRAEKQNTNCLSCAMRSEEVRKKISESLNGITRSEETRKRMSESHKGKKRSGETRKRMRLSRLKYIENTNGQVIPNSNPEATRIIRAKAKELGITDLQDAETPGGEFQVCGYFVDGRSEEKNIVFEYYEKAHKYQTERDERRKNEIIKELSCEFIEIRE